MILLRFLLTLIIFSSIYTKAPCLQEGFFLENALRYDLTDCIEIYGVDCCSELFDGNSSGVLNQTVTDSISEESLDEKIFVVHIINGVISSLSFFSCLYILHDFFKNRKTQYVTTASLAIISMFFSDLVLCIAKFMVYFDSETVMTCIQGFLSSASVLSSYCWGFQFISLIQDRMNARPSPNYSSLLVTNIMISILPSVLTSISVIFGGPFQFRNIDGFTIITPFYFDVFIYGVPFSILGLGTAFIFFRLYNTLKEYMSRSQEKYLLIYPIVIVIMTLPSMVGKVFQFSTGQSSFWITMIPFCTTSSLGFVNALVYKNQLKSEEQQNKHIQIDCEQRKNSNISLINLSDNNSFSGSFEFV